MGAEANVQGPEDPGENLGLSSGETGATEVLSRGGTGPSQDPSACGTENGQWGTEQERGAQ